jgi:hypothetical protein
MAAVTGRAKEPIVAFRGEPRCPLAAVILSGCVTAEEQFATKDDAVCLSYGAPKGSAPYVQCRMQLAQNRSNANMVNSPLSMVPKWAVTGR